MKSPLSPRVWLLTLLAGFVLWLGKRYVLPALVLAEMWWSGVEKQRADERTGKSE